MPSLPAAEFRTRFARLLASIWFRSLQTRGEPPPAGPVLWVINHPNGLVDGVAAAAALPGAPRFMGKATLWKVLPLKPLLAIFQPIPVHRRADGDAGPEATAATFAAVHEAFARGESVALFPEGISHAFQDLAPLKTGAARIVLSSPVAVQVVPAGLVYGQRETFRHSALVRLGAPVPIDDLRAQGATPAAVRELTARLRAAMLPLTLHGPDDALSRLAERLAWLLADGPRERVDLEGVRARVRLLGERLRQLPPDQQQRVFEGVEQADAALARSGMRPDQVGFAYSRGVVARWLPGFLARLAIAPAVLPLALWWWPVYRVTGFVIDRLTVDLDVVSTYKFLLGLVLFPLWLVASVVLAGLRLGAWGVAATLVAAALAFVVLPLSERLREDVQAIRGFMRRRDPIHAALVEQRAALLTAFPELETVPG